MEFLTELLSFLRMRKKLWLAPLIIIMIILGGLLILAQGSVVAPFIYTLLEDKLKCIFWNICLLS